METDIDTHISALVAVAISSTTQNDPASFLKEVVDRLIEGIVDGIESGEKEVELLRELALHCAKAARIAEDVDEYMRARWGER